MAEKTLGGFFGKLNHNERVHLLHCLEVGGERGWLEDKFSHIHAGLLPMVAVKDALFALSTATLKGLTGEKFRVALRAKLCRLGAVEAGTTERFVVYLDSGKVAKRFGNHPERGIKLPGHTKRVTAGVKWNLPKRAYVPDEDATVNAHFLLKCVGRFKWELAVDYRFAGEVLQYLTDHCT